MFHMPKETPWATGNCSANFLKIWILTSNRQKDQLSLSKNNQVIKSCVQRNEFPGSKPLESGVSRQTYRNKGISDLDMLYIMPPISMNIITVRIMVSLHCLQMSETFWRKNILTRLWKRTDWLFRSSLKTFMSRFNLYSDRMMTALNSLKAIMEEHGALQNLFTKRRPWPHFREINQ